MSATRYVNKPGSVIAHLDDGTTVHLGYGDPVPENLADYATPENWSDTTPRRVDANAALEAEANRRAALAEGGQVNSSSSSVPGNYKELDEDGAATLVGMLDRYPGQQAQILIHEILYCGGRRKVIDGATPEAKAMAEEQIGALSSDVTELATEGLGAQSSGLGDPDVATADQIRDRAARARTAGRTAPAPSSTPDTPETPQTPEAPAHVDYSDSKEFKVEDLERLASERGIENIQGTGADDAIVRADLEKALTEHDAAQAQS